ncbi:SDR family NAD(P)-dependent oxidoreductase [Chryseomicrobium palamuruense]|uniref:SDR family NAD(P)-dependent oxidoreductase n=1 Tax=Chryseomicrobium palamuruense TaxID=682973 RepID=A0ABV8USJ9_9BACL
MNFLNDLFSLKGKVAIVTGSSKGIGREIAIAVAKAGADVALVARNEKELNSVVLEIKELGQQALAVPVDLLETSRIENEIKKINDYFGHIDILINNAGANVPKPATEVSVDDWDRVLDINLKSTFFVTQAVSKYMLPSKKGKVINMSSQMAFVGFYKRAAYSSSKGGLNQLTKALAIEWADHNINVNSIAPTFIKTPMTEPMFQDKEFLGEVMARIPLGRLGETKDLIGAVIYLASPASDLVTGHTLVVDGGWTVW